MSNIYCEIYKQKKINPHPNWVESEKEEEKVKFPIKNYYYFDDEKYNNLAILFAVCVCFKVRL